MMVERFQKQSLEVAEEPDEIDLEALRKSIPELGITFHESK